MARRARRNPAEPAEGEAVQAERLVFLEVWCPNPSCGKREARKVAAWRFNLYQDVDPERVAETIICGGCGEMYVIPAKAYQRGEAA